MNGSVECRENFVFLLGGRSSSVRQSAELPLPRSHDGAIHWDILIQLAKGNVKSPP